MARRWGAALSIGLIASAYGARASAQSPPSAPETIPVGDWQLAPTLEIRTRGEYWRDPVDSGGGVDAARVRDGGGIMERARLGLAAERGPLRAQFTLQDARAWGVPPPTATLGGVPSGFASTGAYEAFVEARSNTARPNYLRVGRQVVVWGEGRLLGNADFSPVGRSLDAARAHAAVSNFDFELLAALLSTPHPLGSSFGDTGGPSLGGAQLYGAAATWTVDPLFLVQAFAFAKIARSGGANAETSRSHAAADIEGELYTGALRIAGEKSGFRYGVEGAYQFGTATDLVQPGGIDREAYAAAAYASKTLDRVALTPTFRLGGAYASGDNGSGKYKQFDPLLPDTHTFHGAMDIFAWSNLVEATARVTVVPFSDTTFAVEYRYARMADANGEWLNGYLTSVGRATASTSAELGHEVDAAMTWAPWPSLSLLAGYSAFVAGDGARTVLGAASRGEAEPNGSTSPADVTHYAYVQATLRVP